MQCNIDSPRRFLTRFALGNSRGITSSASGLTFNPMLLFTYDNAIHVRLARRQVARGLGNRPRPW